MTATVGTCSDVNLLTQGLQDCVEYLHVGLRTQFANVLTANTCTKRPENDDRRNYYFNLEKLRIALALFFRLTASLLLQYCH